MSESWNCPPSSQIIIGLLLLSCFSRVRLCESCPTPETAAHQAPPSLGFSRQEHWSGLPFPSPMHESEKSKWSCLVVSDSSRPHGLRPTRLLSPWDFPGKSTGVGCHCLLWSIWGMNSNSGRMMGRARHQEPNRPEFIPWPLTHEVIVERSVDFAVQ